MYNIDSLKGQIQLYQSFHTYLLFFNIQLLTVRELNNKYLANNMILQGITLY